MEKKNVTIRKPAFAGSFYPSTKKEILAYFQRFEKQLNEEDTGGETEDAPVSGLIVPHAGWVYSGKTAYAAHRMLKKAAPKKIALLGPSHHALFHSVYCDPHDLWESPMGQTTVIHNSQFPVHPSVHNEEHSLEVQLPFIQYFSPNSMLLPLIVGHLSETQAREFAEMLDSYFLIISTDLSHYHPLDEARKTDSLSITNIENLNDDHVDACGINPLRIAFAFMRQRGLKPRLIDYSTSAEAFGDASAVVGYAGFWF